MELSKKRLLERTERIRFALGRSRGLIGKRTDEWTWEEERLVGTYELIVPGSALGGPTIEVLPIKDTDGYVMGLQLVAGRTGVGKSASVSWAVRGGCLDMKVDVG